MLPNLTTVNKKFQNSAEKIVTKLINARSESHPLFKSVVLPAREKELEKFDLKGVLEIVQEASVPSGAKVVDSLWLDSIVVALNPATGERDAKGKSRWIARGDQLPLNYSEDTASHTLKLSSFLLFIRLCVHLGLTSIEHVDVSAAYLNAPTDEEL